MDAIEFGHECCKKIAAAIRELVDKVGQTEEGVPCASDRQGVYAQIEKAIRVELTDAMNTLEV